MGNYKFRISDMIPNAWFHKLKDMTKPKHKPSSSSTNTCSKKEPSSQSLPLYSSTSYLSKSLVSIDPHTNSPRNSLHTRRMTKRKTLYKPSPKPYLPSEGFNKSKIIGQDSSSHCSIPALRSSPESFVFSFYEKEDEEFVERDFTKQKVKESVSIEKSCHASNSTEEPRKLKLTVKINKEKEDDDDECRFERKYEKQVSSGRKSSAGINLKRVNSPRIHQLSSTRRSTSRSESSKQAVLQSFAVVKRSVDPKKDFRDSMLEMIEENNIKASKDFEDLLACYLSLNPNQYHDLIIQVFEQLWRQLIKTK